MLIRATTAILAIVLALPAQALDLQTYECVATGFVDDSRYPPGDAFMERSRAVAIRIIDAGDRVLVETTYPGSEPDSRQLPVTAREDAKLVAGTQGELYRSTVTVDIPADPAVPYTGTLAYRTYETDHSWSFRCDR